MVKVTLSNVPYGRSGENMIDVKSATMTYDEFIDRYGFDALPKGPFEEYDGSRWRIIEAENPQLEGHKWRWQPLNWEAFGKGEPTGPMREPTMGFRD